MVYLKVMHRTLSKRSSEAIKEVFKEVKRLKQEVRRQALLIKDMQELYELIVQIVDATTDAQVEPKDVEGVTATICDSDNEISYEDLLYENAFKEKFKKKNTKC
jgi:hypothetical protein